MPTITKPCVALILGSVTLPAFALEPIDIYQDRTYDGTYNNLTPGHYNLGAANTTLGRLAAPAYPDDGTTMAGATRPNPRLISGVVLDQDGSIPNSDGLSAFAWQWGQFIDHDLALVPTNSSEPAPILVPRGDPVFDPTGTGTVTLPFNRSTYLQFEPGTGTPRQQVNSLTHWIDGSMVYGSSATVAETLRSGTGGLLKVTTHATGDLLPYNDAMTRFVAGDTRVNEQIGLTAMHTLWMREHNYWATGLAAQNPTWTDEQLYQQARKIVGGEIQAITYNEWLPTLMGGNALGRYAGYDPSVDPRVTNEFTTAAFRLGHTLLQPTLLRLDANGNPIPEGNVALRDAFLKPALIPDEGGIDPILRGLAAAQAQEFDAKIIDDVRNFLFGPPGSGGQDLGSLNIQRGRDHGLPSYNSLRTQLGLTTYDEISDITSDVGLAAALAAVYGDINDIDPWVGILAEDHYANAIFGETAYTILKLQFGALRDGDRFWYEFDPALAALRPTLGSTTLADIIGRNTGIDFAGLRGSLFKVQPAPVPLPGAVWLLLSALTALGVFGRRRRSYS